MDFNQPCPLHLRSGTAFPFYRDRFKGAEGVSGSRARTPGSRRRAPREYYDAHVKKTGKEPDRWASAFAYASLQIPERCVGEVGLDRQRIKAMIDATEFQTVAERSKFTRGNNTATPARWASGRRASSRSCGPRAGHRQAAGWCRSPRWA